jgi:hypothetical protein
MNRKQLAASCLWLNWILSFVFAVDHSKQNTNGTKVSCQNPSLCWERRHRSDWKVSVYNSDFWTEPINILTNWSSNHNSFTISSFIPSLTKVWRLDKASGVAPETHITFAECLVAAIYWATFLSIGRHFVQWIGKT